MIASVLVPLQPTMAAFQSCTPSPGYTHCIRVTYTGADQTFTVPASFPSNSSLIVEVWGAAGGGAGYNGSPGSYRAGGGGGGYSKTSIPNINAGDSFTVVVGQGGSLVPSNNSPRTLGYGGGASPGQGDAGTTAGAGGGLSGVFLDIAKTQPLVISGGGGGASPGINPSSLANSGSAGGGGGGHAAASLGGTWAGFPGTLVAEGAGSGGGQAGAQYLGGHGADTGEPGGGGGGGYFGGGGGSNQVSGGNQNGGGGGGSGFVTSSVVVIQSGNGTIGDVGLSPSDPGIAGTPPSIGMVLNGSGGQYVDGIGASVVNGAGGNGMVVFQWSLPPAATPSPASDVVSSPYMGTAVFSPLSNDSVIRSESGYSSVGTSALDGTSLRLCGPGETLATCSQTVLNTAAGSYSLDVSTGAVTFQAQSGFVGSDPDAPSYKVCIAFTGSWAPTPPESCGLGTISLTVENAPPPTVVSDYSSGAIGSPLEVNVLSNDGAAVGLTLDQSTLGLCQDSATPASSCNLTSLTTASGSVSVNTTSGFVTFTPASGFVGLFQIDYSIADSNGVRAKAHVEFEVLPTPNNPTLTSDSFTGLKSISISGNVVTNDVIPAGASISLENSVASGQLTFSSGGTFLFTPTNNFVGEVSFSYKVCHPVPHAQVCSIAVTTLTVVEPVAPVAVADSFSGTTGQPITGNVLENDTYQIGTSVVVAVQPSNGTLQIQPNGGFTFTANSGFAGVSTFSYQACLPSPHQSLCSDGLVEINIAASAPAPAPSPEPVAPAPVVPEFVAPKPVAPEQPSVGGFSSSKLVTSQGLPVTLEVTPSDSSSQFCLVDLAGSSCIDRVVDPGVGVFELNSSSNVIFTPEIGFTGESSIQLREERVGNPPKDSLIRVLVEGPAGGQSLNIRHSQVAQFLPVATSSSEACLVQNASAGCSSEIFSNGDGFWRLNTNGVAIFEPSTDFAGESVAWIRVAVGSAFEFYRLTAVVAAKRPPVRLVLSGFVDGSSSVKGSFKERISDFVKRHSDYRVMGCIGFTEGPTVLRTDPRLALNRAINVCSYAQLVRGGEFELVAPRGFNQTLVGSWIRRAVIYLRD
jgi:hypothetical protein